MPESYTNPDILVLIVEDSKTQATILQHLIESAGYQVLVANTGEEAVALLHDHRPTLILTDIVMPGMNGYELCRVVKNDPNTALIPVILVTQLYDPQDVIEGLECGADNFIIKPYDNQYLLSRIDVIIANRFLQQNDTMNLGIEVYFSGKRHYITSNRLQILNILLSTYEIAIQKNNELAETKDSLAALNEQLRDTNEVLQISNDKLTKEIIERKRVEAALSQANSKLNLLSSITRHDMKNILMAMRGYHDLALMNNPDTSFHEYLTKESDLFIKLTNQIEFTRLYDELGTFGAVWKPLSIVKTTVFPHSSSIELIMSSDIAKYEIFADPLIEKVFYNLFENSVRHGGSVTRISLSAELSGSSLCVCVMDDGSGIEDDDKEQIFLRGYGKNTGLGLFLVREILSITNISIRETGKAGEGVCFELMIPSGSYREVPV
ncbi:MAG: hybrid sensor histidine kinase/response regulator [Methanospirillum sp.]|uniref:hybrid sensor histidine kinase/response regulator n=1 Tax=Methanospirillum sp. TaxID=45200 RepID=UPI002369F69E|nr:hybrid sensor histidine kinase/response regulator [Methanospirillum sp.]MDD1729173.1 hybrid sensor histidine kinase/response regulator [Methanospirillum sp.]